MPLRPLHHELLPLWLRTVSSHSTISERDPYLLPQPDYFESIDGFTSWADESSSSSYHDIRIVRKLSGNTLVQAGDFGIRSTSSGKPKLLVCHDFKGGYTEDPFERGYSFEFWHLVDTFIYFSHKRITIPPRGWVDAGHRHGSKVFGTVIFEWAESKPDLEKCLYGAAVHGSDKALSSTEAMAPALFSTACASKLIRLAQIRKLDGYLINIETDLNFLPPASSYPGGSQHERDEDAALLKREQSLAGLGKFISSDIQLKREQRMKRNVNTLVSWVQWLRDEGKRLVGPHWEIIWYDSVTTDGKLQWQDALTTANAPFFMSSDAIFTNYTWARPPDPAPPGGLQEPARPMSGHHPALLMSARTAELMGRPNADVYVGIDVFGRNCYGGFKVGQSLDLIFPSRNSSRTEVLESPGYEHSVGSLQDLRFSVALFAPGWTWEREIEDGGERSWSEWWGDELRFWVGRASAVASPGETDSDSRPIGSYFGPRERSFHHILPLAPPSQSGSSSSIESTESGAFHSDIQVVPASVPVGPNEPSITPPPFYTNFNRGSGNSWWVQGFKYFDAPANHAAGKNGWTDIGSCFPKPDRIWPRLPILYYEDAEPVGNIKILDALGQNSQGKWMVDKASLIDYEAWQGGTSLEVLLRPSPDMGHGGSIHEHIPTSHAVLPLCTLNACHLAPCQPRVYSLEIVIKPLSLPSGLSDVRELHLRPYLIWANDELSQECSYHAPLSLLDLVEFNELANGWYRVEVTVQPDQVDGQIPSQLNRPWTAVPVVALGVRLPQSVSPSMEGVSSELRFLVGEIILTTSLSTGPASSPHPCEGSLASQATLSDTHTPSASVRPLIGSLHWESLPRPSTASSTSLWGILTWIEDGAQLGEQEHEITSTPVLPGYYNIFASVTMTESSLADHDYDGLDQQLVWLGTSTYEPDPNSFVVAGLKLSDLIVEPMVLKKPIKVTFCVHHAGAAVKVRNRRQGRWYACEAELI